MNTDDIFESKMKHLRDSENDLEKIVVEYQVELFNLLATEYMPQFITDSSGLIIDHPKNDSLINSIDKYFDKLEKTLRRDALGFFFSKLLENVEFNASYFAGLGFKKSIVDTIISDKVRLEHKLGITPTGKLKKNGYLYKLGKTEQVRQQLKSYVISNLTGDTDYITFRNGLKNLVKGNKDTKGSLQKYFDQYAYDSFNQVDATVSKQLANNLNLNHFIYVGSLIDTSRPFCKKRAGKVYTVEETKKWKNDPTLVGKKTKDSYRPLIERGRYRCRHFIKYITESTYLKLKNAEN